MSTSSGSETVVPNIALVGGVATGKTEVAKHIASVLPSHWAVDTGALFRISTRALLNGDLPSSPIADMLHDHLNHGAGSPSLALKRELAALSGVYSGIFSRIILDAELEPPQFTYGGVLTGSNLQSPEIDLLVPLVGTSPDVRNSAVRWVNEYARDTGRVVLTAHGIGDYDLDAYKTVCLVVDDSVAAARLRRRQNSHHSTDSSAYAAVIMRNESDGVDETHRQLSRYGIPKVDTTHLSVSEVAEQVIAFAAAA
jgi:cytidylate kinase